MAAWMVAQASVLTARRVAEWKVWRTVAEEPKEKMELTDPPVTWLAAAERRKWRTAALC